MQIVLSNDRVIAHGGEYIAMGGTVIDTANGKAYQSATVVEVNCVPCDIDEVGYKYRAGNFIPCAPYGIDNGNGFIMVACQECATPKRSKIPVENILGARLTVDSPAGSVIYATKGSKSIRIEEENGEFVRDLPGYGVWNITSTINGFTGSQSVNVDTVKAYSLRFGSVINVTYPQGVVCTCTKGSNTITAPDKSGQAQFYVCGTGTFTIKIQNGDTVANNTVTITAEGESKNITLDFFASRITVTYPAGATCTCSNGSATYTAPDNSGSHTFVVNSAGTWTIRAYTGSESKSENVTISASGENKSVTIDFFAASITVNYPAGSTCTLTDGTTTYTAPNTSGSYTFVVKNTGNWTARAANSNTSASAVVQITASGENKTVTLVYVPIASASPKSGVSYAIGLSNLSWADISRYSKAIAKCSAVNSSSSVAYVDFDNLHYKFSVGDRKTVTFNGIAHDVQIIGLNHTLVANSGSYGAARAGLTFDFVVAYTSEGSINHSNTDKDTSVLWSNSLVRSTLNSRAFNSDLEAVIAYASVPCLSARESTALAYYTDKVFILSEAEVFGSTSAYSPVAEGSQYAYYAAGNSKIKYRVTGEIKTKWWTRSYRKSTTDTFINIGFEGTKETNSADVGSCFPVPAFCV